MFGVGVLVRLRLSVVTFLYADSVPSLLFAVLCSLPAVGFCLLSVGVWTRGTGIETGGRPIWWRDLRPFHGLLWVTVSLAFPFLHSKRRRHVVSALIAFDTLLGIVVWWSRRWDEGGSVVTRTCATA